MGVRLWGDAPVMIRVDTNYAKDTSIFMMSRRETYSLFYKKMKAEHARQDLAVVQTTTGTISIREVMPTPSHPDGISVTFGDDAVTEHAFVSWSALIENRHTGEWQPNHFFESQDQALALQIVRHVLRLIDPALFMVMIHRTGLFWALSVINDAGDSIYVAQLDYKPLFGVNCTQFVDMKNPQFFYQVQYE